MLQLLDIKISQKIRTQTLINDFLGIGRSIINSDPEFVQMRTEVYIFIAIVYWIFSYLMSLASRRIEETLGVSSNL